VTIGFFMLLGIWLHFHVREALQETLEAGFTSILDGSITLSSEGISPSSWETRGRAPHRI
jgi:hypothetical protein